MRSRQEVAMIIAELCSGIAPLFPQDKIEAIPLGSYARGDSDSGSDIDVLLLVCPQTEKNRGTLDFAIRSPSAYISQLALPISSSPFRQRSPLSSGGSSLPAVAHSLLWFWHRHCGGAFCRQARRGSSGPPTGGR